MNDKNGDRLHEYVSKITKDNFLYLIKTQIELIMTVLPNANVHCYAIMLIMEDRAELFFAIAFKLSSGGRLASLTAYL